MSDSLRDPFLQLDQVDIEIVGLYFETEDRWQTYRTLGLAIYTLIKIQEVSIESEFSWLRKRFVELSATLIFRLNISDIVLSEALELLDELEKCLKFSRAEGSQVRSLFEHLEGVLRSFEGIPSQTRWNRESPRKSRLRFENR